MPGKLADGSTTPNLERTPLPLISQVYCDGRKANKDGELISANPWDGAAPESQENALEEAWDRGWNDYQSNPNDRSCCAE